LRVQVVDRGHQNRGAAMETMSLYGILARNVDERPSSVAVAFGDLEYDWVTLQLRTDALARGMRSAGCGVGDRVALLDQNSLEYFEFVFGSAAIGATAVVLNWRLTARELAFILEDAEPELVIVRDALYERLAEALDHAGVHPRVLVIRERPTSPDDADDYQAWLGKQLAHDSNGSEASEQLEDAIVLQMYTSGTTGTPKGACITNANVVALLQASGEWRMDASSVNLAAMPLFHIGGGGWAIAGMAHGAVTVLMREIDPAELLETVSRRRITHAFLVPSVIQQLLEESDEIDVSSLRFLAYGASPIAEPVLRQSLKRFNSSLCQLYGMTETTGAVVQLDPEEHELEGPMSRLLRAAGKPMPGAEVRIIDPESEGCEVPDGTVGEIWIRSRSVMLGYWRNPEATRRAITSDGWFRSGDMGYREDGYIFINGRMTDMIISGGENIYPAEVESVIMSHPSVGDCSVVGVPSKRWGETPRAVIVVRPGKEAEIEALRSHCRANLAGYKMPSEFVFVRALPRGESGKVRKELLVGDEDDISRVY